MDAAALLPIVLSLALRLSSSDSDSDHDLIRNEPETCQWETRVRTRLSASRGHVIHRSMSDAGGLSASVEGRLRHSSSGSQTFAIKKLLTVTGALAKGQYHYAVSSWPSAAGGSTDIRVECSAVYNLRCIFMARITRRDNKFFVSHGLCHCAQPSLRHMFWQRR